MLLNNVPSDFCLDIELGSHNCSKTRKSFKKPYKVVRSITSSACTITRLSASPTSSLSSSKLDTHELEATSFIATCWVFSFGHLDRRIQRRYARFTYSIFTTKRSCWYAFSTASDTNEASQYFSRASACPITGYRQYSSTIRCLPHTICRQSQRQQESRAGTYSFTTYSIPFCPTLGVATHLSRTPL